MKKLLIINSVRDDEISVARILKESIDRVQKDWEERIEVMTLEKNLGASQERIPRGFDAYLIHPADVCEEDIINLKRKQPTSLVFAYSPRSNPNYDGHVSFVGGISERSLLWLILRGET